MNLFSEIWKWALIVSRRAPKSLLGEVEKIRSCPRTDESLPLKTQKDLESSVSVPEIKVCEETPVVCQEETKAVVVSQPIKSEIPAEPTGEDLQLAKKIFKDVIDDIEFVKKCGTQKDSWLTFSNMPNNPSIRYYVVKNVHESSGIIPRWIRLNEITFTLS